MKAVRLNAPLQAEVIDLPSAQVGPGEVRVKVERAGICGSDAHRFKGEHYLARWPGFPGHECSGTVSEVGPGVEVPIGQRVAIMPMFSCGTCAACRRGEPNHCADLQVLGAHRPGCYAEEIVVAAANLRPLPDGMSMDEGALVEPTGIAVHCANRGQLQPGDRVAILGAGSIGLLIQQVAKARGAGYILATGRVDEKMALARQMGADEIVNATHEAVVSPERADSFDLVFDAVGGQETMDQAISLVRPGGRILALAVPHGGALPLNYGEFYRKELSLRAARLYDADFDEAITLIASGRVKPMPIITHRFALAQAPQALAEVVNNRRQAIKILLEP